MRILITGAVGQLGSAMVSEFSRGHDVVPLTIEDLD
ncbi:MAG: sugar nucleotide-binding protein, partial [Acidobacteria bacterium]|nr:sugar nucleotide-binding protein [Acidobacteriota bacterium]